jgi:hypothetical protein
MSEIAMDAARMLDMLPEKEQTFAYELIKRLVKAWDPEFTKVTPEEARKLADAEESGFIDEKDIDWEHLDRMV